MATGPQFTSRVAARVVLLDPANGVLLFRYVEPWSRHAIWATPGGGLEPGESDAAAARREVVEETGLTDVELSPIIWTRESIFDWGAQHVHQHERFFFARIGTWELPSTLWQAHQEEGIQQHRWWTIPELERATESIAPQHLPKLVRALLAEGLPAQPIDLGSEAIQRRYGHRSPARSPEP